MQVFTLENRRLENFLERHKAYYAYTGEIEIDRFLREILQKANEFVPSEAGSILLDDPMTKNSDDRLENELVFIATYGAHGEARLGKRMNARVGIVGHVYATGVAYMTDDVVDDPFFYPTLDLTDGFQTKSALCVPVRIESSVCGVLELVNRTGPGGFREKDRRLLEIFADYASISIQNLLDARRAYEVAKRDGLTGLYNERYLHLRLTQELSRISRDGGDCCIVFLDLDNLKAVNDRHGHLAGSQVLREVGYLLRRTVTDERATLTRYGGDEFVLILPGHNLQEGLEVCEAIRTGDPDRDVPLPALRIQRAGPEPPGRDHRLARPVVDPHPRHPGGLRRAAEERAAARRRHRPLPGQGARQGPQHGGQPRGRTNPGAVLLTASHRTLVTAYCLLLTAD